MRPQPQSEQAREAPGVFILSDVRLYREGVALSLACRGELAVRGSAAPGEVDLEALVRSGALVLLLDASMGGGLELMKRLKIEAPQVKIVAVSVNDSDDDRLAHIEAGAAGCVAREGSIEELVQAVLGCVRGEAACSATLAARLFDRLAALSGEARTGAASVAHAARTGAAAAGERRPLQQGNCAGDAHRPSHGQEPRAPNPGEAGRSPPRRGSRLAARARRPRNAQPLGGPLAVPPTGGGTQLHSALRALGLNRTLVSEARVE